MAVIHITEAEAARDLASLLDRVTAGERVQIDTESASFQIVRLQTVGGGKPRLLSEIISSMEANPSHIKLDDQFGRDLEEIIESRQHERLIDPWESF